MKLIKFRVSKDHVPWRALSRTFLRILERESVPRRHRAANLFINLLFEKRYFTET